MNQDNVNPALLNKVKERLLILSPTVKAGLERECNKGDFYREGDKCIGKGGFGEVWKVVHKKTNKVYVIKVIDKKSIRNQKLVKQINREIEIMYTVHHPHLMQLINHFEDDEKFFMIMPFASRGQLYTLLRRQVRFDQRTAAQYMRETIAAVKYLHEHKIIHRDIKPENLLLDDNYRVKLSDFGWSNFKEEEDTRVTYCGTPEYLAPEMVRKAPHDYGVDIWSLGVLLFEFLAGYAPFTGGNQNELFSNIKKLKINWPVDFPPLAKNLVTKILKLNPKERPSLDEISSHSWFEQNPPYRPVLVNTLTDPKLILESHLVNVTPEMVKDEIDIMMSGSPKEEDSSVRGSIIQKRQSTLRKTSTGSSELNSIITNLQNENEKMKKIIEDLIKKNNKVESDNANLKSEINKLEDVVIAENEKKIRELSEEIEKYKIINSERLGLLSEIEEKNNVIIDYKTKFKNIESEKENIERENENNLKTIQELTTQLNNKEEQIEKLDKKITELSNEKDNLNTVYQKKLMELQKEEFEKAELDDEKNANSLKKVIELLSESVDDFKENFGSKLENFSTVLNDYKENLKRKSESFRDLLGLKSEEMIEVIKAINKNFFEDFTNLQNRIEENSLKKQKEVIEWYKKQLSELYVFKNKSIAYETKISQLEQETKKAKEKMTVAENQKILSEGNEKLKTIQVDKLSEEVDQLKSKIQDMKLFVMDRTKKDPETQAQFKEQFFSKKKEKPK